MENIRDVLGSITLVTENYQEYKKQFRNLSCCEPYFIFDANGELISYGLNKNLLDRVSLKSYFNKSSFRHYIEIIRAGISIDDNELLKSLKYVFEREGTHNFVLIYMFNDICSGCSSGKILNKVLWSGGFRPKVVVI
jgi:hypothetical protein